MWWACRAARSEGWRKMKMYNDTPGIQFLCYKAMNELQEKLITREKFLGEKLAGC
jgi:hypothetical protein